MAEKKLLLDIQLQTDQFVDKIKTSRDALAKLKEENVRMNWEAKEALKYGLTATYEELRTKIIANEAAQRQATGTIRDSQKSIDLQTKALTAQDGSYEQLLRNQQLAQTQLKLMAGSLQQNADGTIELTEEYKKQAEQVRIAKEALIAFDQGIKDGRTNVGNYTASFSDAIEKSGLFNDQLSVLKETYLGLKSGQDAIRAGLDMIKEGFNSGVNGVKNFGEAVKKSSSQAVEWFTTTIHASDAITTTSAAATEATVATQALGASGKVAGAEVAAGAAVGTSGMTALKVAIASTGIGLLVVALGSVIAFFQRTERGAEMLERGMAGLSAIFGVIVDKAALAGEYLVNAFSNPKQALLDLAGFIKDQIVNRFIGLEKILQGIITMDFKKIGDGFVLAGTGVEGATDKIKGFAAATGQAIDQMKRAAEAAAFWKGQQQDLEDRMRSESIEIEKNNIKIQEALKLSKDLSISTADRLAALREAGELEKRNSTLKAASTKDELNITREQILAGKELTAAERDRFNALTSSTVALTEAQQQELSQLQTKANLRDEDLNKIAEAVKEEVRAAGESAATQLTISKRLNQALADERKKYLTTVLGIYAEEARQAELSGAASIDLRKEIAKKEREVALSEIGLTNEQRIAIELQYSNKILEINNQLFEEQAKAYERNATLQESIRKRNADAAVAAMKAELNPGDLDGALKIRLTEIQNGLIAESNAREKSRSDELLKSEQFTNSQLEKLKFDTSFKSKSVEEQGQIISGIIETGRQEQQAINDSYDAQALAATKSAAAATQDAVQQSNDKTLQSLLEFNRLKDEASGGSFEEKLALQIEALSLQEQAEIDAANASITNAEEKESTIALIHQKYANAREQVTAQSQANELALTASMLGQASALFKKNTMAYKVLATGQAIIDTYRGATLALATLPPPYGGIQAAITTAVGLANVAKINGVNFAAGGGRFRTKGPTQLIVGDNPGGVEEVTVRPISGTGRTHVDPSGNLVRMAGGGILEAGTFNTPAINVPMSGMDGAAIADIVIRAIASQPAPVVGVAEFTTVSDRVTQIKERASI